MEYINRCIKFRMPNGHAVDVLESVISEIANWLQHEQNTPESCGLLIGYSNAHSGNITISDLTIPQDGDIRERFFCQLRDEKHFTILSSMQKQQNFFLGVWHTHPQKYPIPSSIDWNDWNDTLSKDKAKGEYVFFVIAGTAEFRIWVGNFLTGHITEILEAKSIDGVYTKEHELNTAEVNLST